MGRPGVSEFIATDQPAFPPVPTPFLTPSWPEAPQPRPPIVSQPNLNTAPVPSPTPQGYVPVPMPAVNEPPAQVSAPPEQPPTEATSAEEPRAQLPPGHYTMQLPTAGGEASSPSLPLTLTGAADSLAATGAFTEPIVAELIVPPPEEAVALSPLGVAFTLDFRSAGRRLPLSSVRGITLTLNYSSLYLPYGGSVEERLVLYRVDLNHPQRVQALPGRIRTDRHVLEVALAPDLSEPDAKPEGVETAETEPPMLEEPVALPEVMRAGSGSLYVLATSGSGAQGSYESTPLANVRDYQVGLFTGAAETSYAIPMPPAPAGEAPEVVLRYDSGSVDGMHTHKNNQPGWVGIGWSLEPGYIVHHLKTCYVSVYRGGYWYTIVDLCPTDQFSIVLNGVASRLVLESGNLYRLQSDPRWKVERLTSSHSGHPDWYRHYWQVTTPDGVKYRFGGEFDPETGANQQSVFWTPVYHSNNPCGDSIKMCKRAWRWNLDRVEDPNGNVIRYYYQRETNWYSAQKYPYASSTYRREYVRGGWLERMEYGRRAGETGTPPARVLFEVEERCTPGSACTWPGDYPDTPGDLACTNTGNCYQYAPTFWTRKRLNYIETQVYEQGTSTWRPVARYDLDYSFPDPPRDAQGDTSEKKLWLQSITQRPGGGGNGLPPVSYSYTWLPNRRNYDYAGVSPMYMPRIQTITTELGGEITFTYGTPHLCPSSPPTPYYRLPYDCFPAYDAYTGGGGWVFWRKHKVTQLEIKDTFSGNAIQAYTYTYSTPTWHYSDDPTLPEVNNCPSGRPCKHWNDFRGHEIVTVTDASGAKTEYRFYRGMNGDRLNVNGGSFSASITLSDGSTRPDENWLRGQAVEVRRLQSDNSALTRRVTWYTWTLTAGSGIDGAYFVGEQATEETRYGTVTRVTRTEFAYDSYGNVTLEVQKGDITTGDDDRTIERSYIYNTTAYIVDRPQWEKLWAGTAPGASGQEQSYTAYAYDGQSIGAAPIQGNLTLIRRYAQMTPTTVYYDTTTAYDERGRPTQVTDANNHTTTTTYHPFYGTVQSVTNALGHVTQYTHDPGWGVPLTVTDPNGHTTTYQYDTYGRLVRVWLPTEPTAGPPSVEYVYAPGARPAYVRSRQLYRADAGLYLEAWTYYDGLGREIQHQRPALDANQRVLISQQYNSLGQLEYVSAPYQIAGAAGSGYALPSWSQLASYHRYAYDELGNRRLDETRSYGDVLWAESAVYDGWQVRRYDPNGQRTDYDYDAFGRLAQVTEYNVGGATYVTRYAYDRQGNLTQVTDAQGNVTAMSYNLLGWKTAMSDPDMGSWAYQYDGVGNLTAQRDGRGLWVYQEYDALNRLIRKRQDSPTGPLISEYLYDAPGQVGLLSVSKAYGGEGTTEVRYLSYDARGRLLQQEWAVPGAGGGAFRLAWTYDAADHVTSVQYPANNAGGLGEIVQRIHNPVGQLDQVISQADGTHYVASTLYAPTGQAVFQRYDQFSYEISRFFTYQEGSRRLTEQKAGNGGSSTNLQWLTFHYDNAGNVLNLTDGVNGGQKQCFQYDWLHRLTAAFTGNADCTAYSGVGVGAYTHIYAYDAIGNLTSYNGHAYTYGSGRPHAVTAAFGQSYGYDGNGNQTTRTLGGVTYTLGYDYDNRLTEVRQGQTVIARFAYDADGNRVKGTVNGMTTVYIGGIYEYRGGASTRYYLGHGGVVALRREGYPGDNGLFYLLGDHLGSTSVIVRREGTVVAWHYYYPFGGNRNGPFSGLTTKRFTGQHHEPELPGGEGLYDYHARWYDAQLGRFITADPIVPEPGNPQDLNRYSYVRNNPVRYTDPTGHYILLEEDFGVRITRKGAIQVVRGGHRFANPVEMALANAILSRNPRHLRAIPADTPGWAVRRSLARVSTELGYGGSGIGLSDLLLDPVLIAGLGMVAGKSAEDALQGAASLKGRFVRETLPSLPEDYRNAFEGEPVIRTLQPGQKLYRAELSTRPPSRWFGTQPTTSLARAERWWNILKYGPRDVLRVYEVTEPVTVYYGKVTGGRGTQILLPLDVKPTDVVRRIDEWPLR